MNKNIVAKIFSLKTGLEVYNDVRIIRMKSKKYRLLIMVDYLPIIGEIEGNIDIETATTSINLHDVKGYYMHSNNVFNLIIKED